MPQVLTEGVNLAVVLESTLGATTPPTSGWYNLQPNSLGDLGPSYKKLARTPISKNRQNRQPILVDEDSKAPWESDVTKDVMDDFIEGIFMSATKHSGGTGLSLFRPTAVTNGSPMSFTVAASGGVQALTLFFGRGFTNAANNGVHVAASSSTGTTIKVTSTLVTETPPANAQLEIAGIQGASDDIVIDGSGNLTATLLDFTTLGLNVGQWIYLPTPTGGAAFAFANTVYTGFARIKTIAAGKLTLERRSWVVGSTDAGAGKTIRIFFTKWIRNVAIDHADYKTPSYAFEVTYPNLGAGPVAEYEYMLGNLLDEWIFNIPLTSKATTQMSFMGTTSLDPTSSRKTGPSSAYNPVTNLAVSTATDLMRLRMSNVDETGISTDFQSIKLTIKNNVTPEKELGQLGASLMNVGRFDVMIEADVIFTSHDVIVGVHDNRTTSMDIAMRNSDFGMLLDVASMSIDSAGRKFEANKSVVIVAKTSGFQDSTLGYTMSTSMFAYLPAV